MMGHKFRYVAKQHIDYWLLAALSFMLGAVVIPSL